MTTENQADHVSLADGLSRNYLVTPGSGTGPGVLVLHSGRGLTDFVKSLCKRLAREGFVALAVDLFGGETPDTVEEATDVKDGVGSTHAERILEDSAVFLQSHEAASQPAIGVLGLGYGAEWALQLASGMPDTTGAVVLFYGYQPTEWSAIDAPILGHFAEIDHELPPSFVDDLREQLASHDIHTDFFIYRGTEPSFFEDNDAARYEPRAASLAWERTNTFLHRTLTQDLG